MPVDKKWCPCGDREGDVVLSEVLLRDVVARVTGDLVRVVVLVL